MCVCVCVIGNIGGVIGAVSPGGVIGWYRWT